MQTHADRRSFSTVVHRALTLGVGAGVCLLGAASVALGGDKVGTMMPGAFKYLGNASCSACHTEASKKGGGSNKKGDQCDIWEKSDPHHKSFEVLGEGKSPEIAKKLGIAKAGESDRCLSCHAVNAPADRRDKKFDISEGNSCESCHGPGEKWVKPHETAGWTAGERGKMDAAALMTTYGLIDTTNYAARAQMCVACHLSIDKDMVDAGHPALKFEMAGYNNYNYGDYLPHWEEAKGKANGARLWAVGQAAALAAAGKGGPAVDGLKKVYEAGVAVAKKNFGADTAEALNKATYDAAKCKSAAIDLAATADLAKTDQERFVIASGVAELVSASFDATGGETPKNVLDAINKLMDAKGDGFAAAAKGVAAMAK